MSIVKCSSQSELDKVTNKGGNDKALYSSGYPCYNTGNGIRDTKQYYINMGHKIITAEEYLNEIKAGDTVECIEAGTGFFELSLYDTYVVTEVTKITISIEGFGYSYNKKRFKKMAKSTPDPVLAGPDKYHMTATELAERLRPAFKDPPEMSDMASRANKIWVDAIHDRMYNSMAYGVSMISINPTQLNKGGSMYINSTVAKVFKDLDDALLVTEELGQEYGENNHRAFLDLKSHKDAVLKEAKKLREDKRLLKTQ